MPYISNTKIDYNFISPSFQYTQLQYFCPQIPQQRAGYSTSISYKKAPHYNSLIAISLDMQAIHVTFFVSAVRS